MLWSSCDLLTCCGLWCVGGWGERERGGGQQKISICGKHIHSCAYLSFSLSLSPQMHNNKVSLAHWFLSQISPRKILEEYIESKARRSFHEFGGLTSTPKKSKACVSEDLNRSQGSSQQSPTPSMLRPPSKDHTSWNPGQRSASSPLLHPGRLGHHDSLVKSVSAGGHNGAAVPLLQSPLLRLARGQAGQPPRRARSQGAVSASALPTAVSPLLVNVRGQRRQQWKAGQEEEQEQADAAARADNVASSVISGMNGVYKKCASEEFLSGQRRLKEGQAGLSRPGANPGASSRRGKADAMQLKETFLEQCENITEEFFCDLVTSTPKKSNVSGGGGGGGVRQGLRQAVRSEVQVGKNNIINGALLSSNNNFSPLDENDFDETFDNFPWISESLDP